MIKVIPEISLPIEICVDFRVSEISCGKEHALILTNSGDVYSCGGGRYSAPYFLSLSPLI